MLEERTELGMKDGVDVVGSSLPPCSFEEPDTEGPVFLLDPAVPNADYSLDAIVNAELPKEEADRVLGIFAKSIVTKQNLLKLTPAGS